jgi:hypothetical protein
MPRFFPGRLNKYRKVDLAEVLIARGMAVPTVEVMRQDASYGEHLLDALKRSVSEMQLEQNLDQVRKLGLFLVSEFSTPSDTTSAPPGRHYRRFSAESDRRARKWPGYFNTGVWLLAHVHDPAAPDLAEKHIQGMISDGFVPGHGLVWHRSVEELFSILVIVSPENAQTLSRDVLTNPDYVARYPYVKVRMAVQMLKVRDLYCLDTLLADIQNRQLDQSYKASLLHELESRLRFTRTIMGYHSLSFDEKTTAFANWYDRHKADLRLHEDRYQVTLEKTNPQMPESTHQYR